MEILCGKTLKHGGSVITFCYALTRKEISCEQILRFCKEDEGRHQRLWGEKRGWNSSHRIKSQHLAVGVTRPGEDGGGQIVEVYVPNCSSLREKKCNPITEFIGSSLGYYFS